MSKDSQAEGKAYAGRWVALLDGQVVAQGGTPEEAQRAAKALRPKERADIQYMPSRNPLLIPPIVEQVGLLLGNEQHVFLVGGAVRDLMLQKPIRDYDFTLKDGAIPLARKVADALDGDFYVLDGQRDAGRVLLNEGGQRVTLDFVAQREPSFAADLKARDFTINAMAIDLQAPQALLDPLAGAADLQAKILRACSATAFEDDPVRVLRAMRMAASFDLQIEKETLEWLKAAGERLSEISAERVRDEIFRLLEAPRLPSSLRALGMLNLFDAIVPEFSNLKVEGKWELALQRMRHLRGILAMLDKDYPAEGARDLHSGLLVLKLGRYREQISKHLAGEFVVDRQRRSLLFLAALLIDVNKDVAAQRVQQMKLSGSEIETLIRIIENNDLPALFSEGSEEADRREIYRFFKNMGSAGLDICLLSVANLEARDGKDLLQDKLGRHLDKVRSLMDAYWEQYDEVVSPKALLSGDELMAELGLKPGAQVGQILEALLEAQAAGEINKKKEALNFARDFVK
jgi:tRNA nucleotidyltransferase/poly(A) polymerase